MLFAVSDALVSNNPATLGNHSLGVIRMMAEGLSEKVTTSAPLAGSEVISASTTKVVL